ncbi:MAG: domain S-box protein [Bacteroidota bacterium]|nr:domain S-box protein [Bacteroidota bacterium]
MKTLIIGGGKGCRSLLGLTTGKFLKELKINVLAVVDKNYNASGMVYAREIGLRTYTNLNEALDNNQIEMIIELTGSDTVLQELYYLIGKGIKLVDHTFARIFWDVINIQKELKWQLDELEKLEINLGNEKHFLQSIFDNLTDLAIVVDIKNNIIKANKNFSNFAHIAPESAIGKKCYDVLDHTELKCRPEEADDIFSIILETGQTHRTILLTAPPDDNHWEISRTPIITKEGKIDYILITWRKITERIKLHREIESQEQRFRSFINSAQDWISIKDNEGRYMIVNPVTANAFDLKVEDFIGKFPDEILPSKLSATIKQHDQKVFETKQAHTFDEIIPVHGQDHHFQTVRFPLTDYKNEAIGICTIARDVSNEVRLQEQLVQSEKLAAIGKLAAGVAHEINNPLTGILAYAEDILDEQPDNSIFKDDINVIIRETLRCRDIVRNLLDFARQDKPKFEISDLNMIFENALHLVLRLPQFKDIIIKKVEADFMPQIECDPKQLLQVLLNLMLNAADAMKFKGIITLITEYDKKNDKCSISVSDSGPGIPENLIDKIFEPFFSTKATSGLGLAVTWGIVERHRGTIEVDTADGGGAVFKVVLPTYK